MKTSIIISLDNEYFLVNNFIENLLASISRERDYEIIIVSNGCKNVETISYLNNMQQRFPFFIFMS